MKDRQIISQPRTDKRRYWFKDQEVTKDFASTLEGLGQKIHTEREDDWFWNTWKDRA